MNIKYQKTLKIIVEKILKERQSSIEIINLKLIELYWEIGNMLLSIKEEENFGNDIIKKLSIDLSRKFPDMKGFSARNIKYMIKFAKTYEQYNLLKELLYKLSWSHHKILMQKVKNEKERLWYINKTIEYNWPVNVMEEQIENKLYEKMQSEEIVNKLIINKGKTFENIARDYYSLSLILLGTQNNKNNIEKNIESKIPSIDDIENLINKKIEYYISKMKENTIKKQEYKSHSGVDYVKIGENIKNARKNKNYTQETLSDKLGISIAFYSRIERGSVHINLQRLSQICEILEITEGEVLNGNIKREIDY